MSGVEPLYVGVDWTAGSWFAVAFDRSRFDHAGVFEGIGDLWARYEERAERILVDVPIGLVEDGEAERVCDRLAREILGPRRGTVFTPPVRAATRKRRYPAAKRVNERKSGQPLSEQAFAVSDAIAQVDELLGNVPEAGPVFAESHPEVCFRAFAGDPLDHPKHRAGGYAERMQTLAGYDRDAPPAVQAAAEAAGGHDVAVDDVLDAVVLAYTAAPGPGELRSLPPDPPTDPADLPMRIVYRADDPLVEP
jgi:predicted RNase H-like nuclease